MDSALESRLAQAAHRLPAPEGATTANRRLFSRLRRRGPALVLSPRGAADAYTLDLWRCAVREAVDTAAASACALIVDTSRIDFLSCRALVVLAEEAGRAAERGVPVSLDGEKLDAVTVIEKLEAIGAKFGVGRGIHLGDTIIGTKGRVAFEAPAAEVLITAHRELEKLVMTGRQQRIKEMVAAPYGDLVHEGQHLDPVCRDIEALMLSSQARVTGEVKVLYRPGHAFIEGVTSPYSIMAASKGVYGEAAGEWTAADALGFSKMVGLPGMFWARAGRGK